jgi:hypothetical protein
LSLTRVAGADNFGISTQLRNNPQDEGRWGWGGGEWWKESAIPNLADMDYYVKINIILLSN